MKILIYVRKWNKDFYEKLARSVYGNQELVFISDFRGNGDIWSGEYIYNKQYDYENEAFERNKNDIIMRCRFLRSLESSKAEKLARRFWNGLECRIKQEQYTVVLSALIDCYTMDIIERLSQIYGAHYFSIVQSFITGYSRFTKRGELFDANREASENEVNQVINALVDDEYKVTFALNREKSQKDVINYYVRRRLAEKLYFPFRKLIERDFWNYHYNTYSFIKGGYSQYSIKKASALYKKIDEINYTKESVYVPLHYSPEATVDYWCDNPQYAYYEESVIDTIKNSDAAIHFVVKEHPAMYGKRYIGFYMKLLECGNVSLIHPYENSNQLLNNIDNVLVYTGSVGVEAILRGKRVLTVAKNYYYGITPNMRLIDKVTKADLDYPLESFSNQIFMKRLLRGLFLGKSTADANINDSEIDKIALEMRRIYDEGNET